MPFDPTQRASKQLEGLTLEGGWAVGAIRRPPPTATGSVFSVGYLASNADGRRGFVKAIDYFEAFHAPDTMRELNRLTNQHIFEKDLCDLCAKRYLQHVVVAMAQGSVSLDNTRNPFSQVEYIIFELADGDIRHQLDKLEGFDLPWRLRVLHHVAIGMQQLHGAGIAHQDLKPSNVLHFQRDGSKIADLGCASLRGRDCPRDGISFAGDPGYAPPEVAYGYLLQDWTERRCGLDLFMLGNLLIFLFSQTTMTALLQAHLPPQFHAERWAGTYDEVLPHIREAFDRSLEKVSLDFPAAVRSELTPYVAQLCDPDPRVRGHPQERTGSGSPKSVERYISAFNRLAERAEYGLLG